MYAHILKVVSGFYIALNCPMLSLMIIHNVSLLSGEENDADAGTSSSVATKDKASKKQISWESHNENFMKGQNWKNKKKFGNKKNNKYTNKNKKGKRN